jgi:hypothetical protein
MTTWTSPSGTKYEKVSPYGEETWVRCGNGTAAYCTTEFEREMLDALVAQAPQAMPEDIQKQWRYLKENLNTPTYYSQHIGKFVEWFEAQGEAQASPPPTAVLSNELSGNSGESLIPPPAAAAARNQCDGCAAGMPLDGQIHRVNGKPDMVCQRGKYEPSAAAGAQPVAWHELDEGDFDVLRNTHGLTGDVEDMAREVEALVRAKNPLYAGPVPKDAQAEPKIDFDKIIHAHVEEYELDDGEVHHAPSEFEKTLITDAIMGLLGNEQWDAAWGAHIDSVIKSRHAELEREAIRMRDALDSIYSHNEACRAAVVMHYGTNHAMCVAKLRAARAGKEGKE